MLIEIKKEEVELAKEITSSFDAQKTYNKFNCPTNYIGVLGEIVFDRFLTENGIEHLWVPFIKKDPNMPDFFIKNVAIDLKTTYSDSMWFQEPKFDIYIYAQISSDDKFLYVNNFISKQGLINYKNSSEATKVTRGERMDYVIRPSHMIDIALLEGIRRV